MAKSISHVVLPGATGQEEAGAIRVGPVDPHETMDLTIALKRTAASGRRRSVRFYAFERTVPSQVRRQWIGRRKGRALPEEIRDHRRAPSPLPRAAYVPPQPPRRSRRRSKPTCLR